MKKKFSRFMCFLFCVLMVIPMIGVPGFAQTESVQVGTFQELFDAIVAAPMDGTMYEIEIMADIQLLGVLPIINGSNIKIWSSEPYT